MFLRALAVPVDPQPIFNARLEPYTIDERNSVSLVGPLGLPGPIALSCRSGMVAELTKT